MSDPASWDVLREVVVKIGRSRLSQQLILRGSVPMRVWFGDAAREPADLDLVVADPWVAIVDGDGEWLVAALARVLGEPQWTDTLNGYSGESGWRLTYPRVAIDLAFGQELRRAPEFLDIEGARLMVASRVESLAWKLRWLVGEYVTRPKDLYDAVLLAEFLSDPAEAMGLARDLVREMVEEDFGGDDEVMSSEWNEHIPAAGDWRRSGLPGQPDEWMTRLSAACGPWEENR